MRQWICPSIGCTTVYDRHNRLDYHLAKHHGFIIDRSRVKDAFGLVITPPIRPPTYARPVLPFPVVQPRSRSSAIATKSSRSALLASSSHSGGSRHSRMLEQSRDGRTIEVIDLQSPSPPLLPRAITPPSYTTDIIRPQPNFHTQLTRLCEVDTPESRSFSPPRASRRLYRRASSFDYVAAMSPDTVIEVEPPTPTSIIGGADHRPKVDSPSPMEEDRNDGTRRDNAGLVQPFLVNATRSTATPFLPLEPDRTQVDVVSVLVDANHPDYGENGMNEGVNVRRSNAEAGRGEKRIDETESQRVTMEKRTIARSPTWITRTPSPQLSDRPPPSFTPKSGGSTVALNTGSRHSDPIHEKEQDQDADDEMSNKGDGEEYQLIDTEDEEEASTSIACPPISHRVGQGSKGSNSRESLVLSGDEQTPHDRGDDEGSTLDGDSSEDEDMVEMTVRSRSSSVQFMGTWLEKPFGYRQMA